jgi:hypothetical protein
MPFGLRNAGQTFQRLMDQVLAGLDYVFVYLDDILIASPDERTHQQHLRAVLERLEDWFSMQRSVCSESRRWSFWATTSQQRGRNLYSRR